jgi:glycosyltransferase involved in cell wall biosynthesis
MIKANEVTIVIPCKNEEKTLEPIYKKLKAQGYVVLIPLARRSNDGTKGICERNEIPYFMDSGKGKGAALREALMLPGP